MMHGPIIEDCTIENVGDDFVNVHGVYYRVFAQESPTALVVQRFLTNGATKPALRFISAAEGDYRLLGEANLLSQQEMNYVVPGNFRASAWAEDRGASRHVGLTGETG